MMIVVSLVVDFAYVSRYVQNNSRRSPQPTGAGYRHVMQAFAIGADRMSGGLFRCRQPLAHQELHQIEGHHPWQQRCHGGTVRRGKGGGTLEEVSGQASGVTAAVTCLAVVMRSRMRVVARRVMQVVLQADMAVGMMVVRHDGYHRHEYADKQQNDGDIPVPLHGFHSN